MVDAQAYLPHPNPWFSTEIEYEGIGRAEFLEPKGWVEGPVSVKFNGTGDSIIKMRVENFHTEQSLGTKHPRYDDLIWLLNGRKPHLEGNLVMHGIGVEPNNTCLKLTVNTGSGVFETIGNVRHLDPGFGDSSVLRFFTLQSKFDVDGAGKAEYWVLPLSNFVSEVALRHPYLGQHPLDQHPLRTFPTPVVPDSLTDENQKLAAFSYANSRNNIIVFEFHESLGFIERLVDYEERKQSLLSYETREAITALMIGEIGNNSIDFENIREWLPVDFLHLLSLSTGSLVGAPWFEFRDAKGQLVRRIHSSQWQAPFLKGHVAIDHSSAGGIGWLMTNAPLPLDSHLRVAILLMVKGGQETFHLEDRLAFLFRALDTLTKPIRHKLRWPKVPIDPTRQDAIQTVIDDSVKRINEIGDTAKGDEAAEIKRIADMVRNVPQARRSNEAEAVLGLLDECGLHDEKVIPDTTAWIKRYIKYRTQVIHESYLSFRDGTHEFDEVITLYHHLYDVLLRAILNKLNYDGEYKRAIPLKQNMLVDWVQPDTPASELGYK